MVKFESLELVGFKSFVERTQVVFDDRITAIIGPNGCGKSNLFDAVGWVLGAQNPRYLRGERMEDVIFNGTRKRKPSGLARVTLRLRKTEDHPVVIDGREFTGDSLEISRKLYRSGQSLYLINDRRCRLKDVQQALEDVGLGYASYALIAQGKIDSFLTGKPLDRRALLEEAAQILNYKSRRRSAELKLELAQQNLLRVGDIIAEVERTLRSLKRQASQARRFKALQQEFRTVQMQRFLHQGQELLARTDIITDQLEGLRDEREQLEQQLESAQNAHREAVEQREALEAELERFQQQDSQLLLEIDRTSNVIGFNQEQLDSLRRALQISRDEQESLRKALRQMVEELQRFHGERESLDREELRILEAVEKQRGLFEKCQEQQLRVEEALEELRGDLLRISADAASLGNLKDQLEQRLQVLAGARERLLRDKADYRLELGEATARLKEDLSAIEAKNLELQDLKVRLKEQEKLRRQLDDAIADLRQQESDWNTRIIGVRERLQSLQEVEISHSQYSEGVRILLNHLKQKSGLQTGGTLADRIETSPEFERLIEEFLVEELEYVLVDSMSAAVEGLAEVKALNSGRCTFLSIHSSNGFGATQARKELTIHPEPGVHGTLRTLLRMDPEVEEAFCRTLPNQADAIVVSDLEHAFHLSHSYPESTFITLEGEALTPRGLLTATTSPNSKLGLLGLKRQKRELEKKAVDLRRKLTAVQGALHLQETTLGEIKSSLEESNQFLFQSEKESLRLAYLREQSEKEVEQLKKGLRVVDEEETRLKTEESQLRERLRTVEKEKDERYGQKRAVEATLVAKQEELQQLRKEAERMREQLHRVSSDQKVLEERRSSLQRTLERADEQNRGLRSRLEAASRSEEQCSERIESLTGELESQASRLQELRGCEQETASKLALCRSRHVAWKQEFPALEGQLRELQERRNHQQERKASLDVERARLETQLLNVRQQCLEQCQLTLENIREVLSEVDLPPLATITDSYQDLKERIDTFGPINMTALDEYQSSEERHVFMLAQRQDLEASISDTMKAIQSLNRRSREKFEEAFNSVNRHFQEVFVTLFGGGECGMRLLDEEDILESGIEIYARPPGKKLQNVMLLSGGEKALTVLALLVGLFTYRPSRFCILDEVDAPLDDANVARFNNLVREMSETTQMILVTHNKLTMEHTDSIFGVTMAEPGVSQAVSVKF